MSREIKTPKYSELEKYYLCGIGSNGTITDFGLGIYDNERESFSFPNGSYGKMELFKKPVGGDSMYVISAICLQEIDDEGLLYKYLGNV